MMLYPDMSRSLYENSDLFVFAAPCTQGEWYDLMAQVDDCPKDNSDYLRWCIVSDDSDERVCIVLQDSHDTDDSAEATAAWVRVSEAFNGMVYALKYDPAYRSQETLASVITRTAGVNPSQVRHIITKRRNLV